MSRDERVTLARSDLAARALEGLIAAATYADNLDIGYILHFFVENECHECIPLKVML